MDWLEKNPITSPENTKFIVDTKKDYRDNIHEANNEQALLLLSQASTASLTKTTPPWYMEKYMQLIHVTVEDVIKISMHTISYK